MRISRLIDKILFFTISCLFFVTITIYRPFLSVYTHSLGATDYFVGLVMGVSGLMSIFLRFPLGLYSDFTGKRKSIVQYGFLLSIIGWGITYFYPTPATVLIGKIFSGLTTATWLLYNVIYAGLFKKREVVKAIALLGLASPFGSFIGNTLGGYLVTIDERYMFLGAMGSSFLGFILTIFIHERKTKWHNPNLKEGIKEIIKDKEIWMYGVVAISSLMVPYAIRDAFAPLLANKLGASAIELGFMANIALISQIIGTYMSGNVLNKFFKIDVIIIVGATCLGVSTILGGYSQDVEELFISQGFMGFGVGITFTIVSALVLDNREENKRGAYVGIYQAIYSSGMFIGPFMVGILSQIFDYKAGFIVMGAQVLLIMPICAIYLKKTSKNISMVKHTP